MIVDPVKRLYSTVFVWQSNRLVNKTRLLKRCVAFLFFLYYLLLVMIVFSPWFIVGINNIVGILL